MTNHVNQLTHAERDLIAGTSDFAADHWHLFDTRTDLGKNCDVGDEHPEMRDQLVARWYEEAERNGVLPVSDGVMDRIAHLLLPWPTGARRVELRAGERVFEDKTPTLSHGFTIIGHLGRSLAGDPVGVLAEQGDYTGGWVWHLGGGTLKFTVSFASQYVTNLTAPIPVGASILRLVGRSHDGGMSVVCGADGEAVATMRLPHECPGLWSPNLSASLLGGVGRRLPVCDGYDPLVAFSGQLELLVVEADGGAACGNLAHQVATGMLSQ